MRKNDRLNAEYIEISTCLVQSVLHKAFSQIDALRDTLVGIWVIA